MIKVILYLIILLIVNFSFSMPNLPNIENISITNNQNNNQKIEQKLENVYFKAVNNIFLKNQPICFYLENLSDKELVMPSLGSYAIFQKEKPETATYTLLVPQVITYVKPKEKKQWCWDQKDFEGKEVSSGDYFVRLTIFDKEGKTYFLIENFTIKIK